MKVETTFYMYWGTTLISMEKVGRGDMLAPGNPSNEYEVLKDI